MLDIAPFGYRAVTADPPAAEIRWEEARDLVKLVLHFPAGAQAPSPRQVRLLYWRRLWPQTRREALHLIRDWPGWEPQDDWYNGEWQQAHVRGRATTGRLTFTFQPLAMREFPDLSDYNVRFRRTMRLRIELPPGSPQPERIEALVAAKTAEDDVCIWWEAPATGQGRIEGYNCEPLTVAPLPSAGPAAISGLNWTVAAADRPCGLCAKLRYVPDGAPAQAERSILTVRCSGRSFSFFVAPVVRGEVIHAPELGVTVWPAALGDAPPPFTPTGETIYDRVHAHREQSYGGAMAAMPPRKPFYFVLGCEGARQKFRLEPDGDLHCPRNFLDHVPAADTPRLRGEGTASFRFGLESWLRISRFIEDGYLPIVHSAWMRGALRVEQVAFAAPISSPIAADAEPDGAVAAFLRFRFANTGEQRLTAELPIRAIRTVGDGRDAVSEREESLITDGDLVLTPDDSGARWVRMVAAATRGSLSAGRGEVVYRADLAPGASSELVLKVPFLAPDESEVTALRAKGFAAEHSEVRRFWQGRIEQGCEIETPELDLNDFYRAHLTHMLISNDHEVGSERMMARVGSLKYGVYANESCMCISDLDRRGYNDLAARCLETLVHYQGTLGLSGNFSSKEGQFYAAGGYEHGPYYVQHHGWTLWCLAQHYLYTRDEAWLRRVAPNIVAGCDWIVRERRGTKTRDADGRKALEWGMLAAGGLEDVGDWYHWLSNNAFSWWGLHHAAAALAQIGHPEAGRLVQEAAEYGDDIRAAWREASVRSPLVKLRDGSFVPHFPSRLYLRGRDFGWIRETLEGAIHLICTGLCPPDSSEASWIVKDYEDNRYLSHDYGYVLRDEASGWFGQGGFSRQPNLLWGPIAYLLRDDVPHYLRGYFNSFAVAFRSDTRMLTEHPLPTFADWAGDHFKTSDEAQSTNWLRLMFVREVGDELHLGQALPREWLGDGRRIAIRRAMTHFGEMSMEIESHVAEGEVTVRLDPPRRNPPSRIRLRLRHPEKAKVGSVEVDGAPSADYRIEGEWIVFPRPPGPVTMVARF
ncbi:MAG: hypothetical protein ACE149_11535 [Armatimonadota bacterium]